MKKIQRPLRDAMCAKSESRPDPPIRVRRKRAELLAAKRCQQAVVDEIGELNRPLTEAERDRLLLALRTIREIQRVQTTWRGGRL